MADPKAKQSPAKVSKIDSNTPNVWQRINAVRAEVTTVAKDKTVGEGEWAYKVATHEVIKEMLRPLMAKHGLVDYILETEYERFDTKIMRGSQVKRPLIQHRGKYRYIVVNVDDPKDTHNFPVRGDGEDAGDKGPGKASTYALKAGQKILFAISADEDEEGRIPEAELESQAEQVIDPSQLDNLLHLAKQLFEDKAKEKLTRMCHALFSIDSLSELPAIHYEHAVNALNNQRDREDKEAAEKDAAMKDQPAGGDI